MQLYNLRYELTQWANDGTSYLYNMQNVLEMLGIGIFVKSVLDDII